MLLLLDIGNTHTHLGLADSEKIFQEGTTRTDGWFARNSAPRAIEHFIRGSNVMAVSFCSVVPRATPLCQKFCASHALPFLELTAKTIRGVGIDYPRPATIGPDRLANAVAAKAFFGAPAVVVDFGTAVTFDVVNQAGNYTGGIIAPGLSAMTDYLHEKTALLPRIKIREPGGIIGKNTEQAMLIGAVHGYRGLVRGLIGELKAELKTRRLPVVGTGGYAQLIATGMREFTAIRPNLTLDGLRLVWQARARELRESMQNSLGKLPDAHSRRLAVEL
jgi:type III pantothenate kinase